MTLFTKLAKNSFEIPFLKKKSFLNKHTDI
jgi:hypothetical protein